VHWEDPRILVVPAAGVSFRIEALDDPSFDPGRPLALVPEPENEHDPNAVGIWNEERTLQAGYVPREVASELAGGASHAAALNSGYHLAYLIGVALVGVAVVVALAVLRSPAPMHEGQAQPEPALSEFV